MPIGGPRRGGSLARRLRGDVDLRVLFAEPKTTGACVLFAQTAGEIAALLVDGVDGLVEVDDQDDLARCRRSGRSAS